MSDLDTIRWGDTQTLVFAPAAGGSPAGLFGPPQTKQLVHAHWSRPCTWKVLVYIAPTLPASEAGTFNAAAQITVGCGGGMVQFGRIYTFAPTAGVYTPQLDIFDVPAQDIQAQILLNGTTPATQDVDQESWLTAIMVAPITEPAGYTDVADMLRKLAVDMPHNLRNPDSEGLPRWMPEGFEDGELRYRK